MPRPPAGKAHANGRRPIWLRGQVSNSYAGQGLVAQGEGLQLFLDHVGEVSESKRVPLLLALQGGSWEGKKDRR